MGIGRGGSQSHSLSLVLNTPAIPRPCSVVITAFLKTKAIPSPFKIPHLLDVTSVGSLCPRQTTEETVANLGVES